MIHNGGDGQYMPMVIERSRGQERGYDLFSRLLIERIIFLGGPISATTSDVIVAQLLFLESQNDEEPITMYINSPGGEITAGLAIVDTMNYIKAPVHTTAVGRAASMGAFILASGHKGERSALPNSELLIHQPLGGVQGQASDIAIHSARIKLIKKRLNHMLAERTGQSYETICLDTERDNFLDPDEAVEYGLIDKVITNRP